MPPDIQRRSSKFREDLGRLVQKYKTAIQKNIFLNILSNTSLDFISDMGVTDRKHYDRYIENEIENFRMLFKNRSF